MKRLDALEANDIANRMLMTLASGLPPRGRSGSDARTAIGDARAHAFDLLMADQFGQPLADCFDQARLAGISMQQVDTVRVGLDGEAPTTLGGALVQNSGIRLCLATECQIISGMTFVSRQDVEAIRQQLLGPFQDAEEIAADEMDQMTYQALVALHGAVTNHLVTTARPLPRMLTFQFFEPLPSLVMSYRLYDDAGRADELVQENKIVHPAFCPPAGQALSS